MGHDQEDDPGSSCLIKQEPADEGIYASSRERTFSEIFSWHNKTDARGLTLQPVRQSLDPQPTHVVRSPSDEENRRLGTNLGIHGEGVTRDMLFSSVPQYDASDAHSVSQAESSDPQLTSVSTLRFMTAATKSSQESVWFDPFRSVSPPPSQEQVELHSVSPPYQQTIQHSSVPNQRDEFTPQGPSVSIPSVGMIRAKALQKPKQSDDSALVTKEQIADNSAMQLDPQEQRISRTPSVSTPQPCATSKAKTFRQPQQSDCFASNSQTPGRSETPPTPVDFENCFPNDFTLPDDCFGGPLSNVNSGKGTATPVSEHNPQRQFATNAIIHGSQDIANPAQRTEAQSSQAKSVIDLTAESDASTSTPLRAGPNHQLHGAATVFNPNTPMQSIECQQVQQPSPTTSRTPRDQPSQKPDINSDVTFQEQLRRYMADKNQLLRQSGSVTPGASLTRSESLTKCGTIGKGELLATGESHDKPQQHKRSTSLSSLPSRPSRPDPSFLHKFSTFMNLRNSLPIAALIAMMAPPNQTQVLTNLAEIVWYASCAWPSSTCKSRVAGHYAINARQSHAKTQF